MIRNNARSGYSAVELLIALTIMGMAASVALPAVGRTLGKTRVARAATVVAADLQFAQSTAARNRTPVRVSVDATTKIITVQNHANPTTIYAQRHFGKQAEYAVGTLKSDVSSVVLYPNGRAAGSILLVLATAGETRSVRMNRAGQIRITQ